MDSSLAWILRSSASCWSLRREISRSSLFLGERVHLFGCGRGGGLCGGRALLAAATSASAAWTLAFNSRSMASEASALARTVASSSLASVASLESAAFSAVSSLRRLSAALSFLADVSRAGELLFGRASERRAHSLCALWGAGWWGRDGWISG